MRLARVGFSPVKGTRHLSLEDVRLDPLGAVGDRRYCLVDASAPRVLRTVQHGALVAVEAAAGGEQLSVTLPGEGTVRAEPTATGETVICDYWGRPTRLDLLRGPHAELISGYLGKPVRLARAPRRAIVYDAGLSIVTTASIRALADRLGDRLGPGSNGPNDAIDPARFRATMVLETDEPYAEERWHGRLLRVGGAVVRIGTPIPRCAVVDLSPATGRRDLPLFKQLSADRPRASTGEPWFGVYAETVEPGVVRPGDEAELIPG